MWRGRVDVIGWLCMDLRHNLVSNLRGALEGACLEGLLHITQTLENDQAPASSSSCKISACSSAQHFLAEKHLLHFDADVVT
jgi:hypothetical protein